MQSKIGETSITKDGLTVIPKHPTVYAQTKSNRLGEVKVNNQGIKMEIVGYRNCKDIDVQLETGEILEHREYRDFLKGTIKNIQRGRKAEQSRIGKTKLNTQGRLMTLIRYGKSSDIDIQFEDGTVIEHRAYHEFEKGKIKHPDDKDISGEKIGETLITKDGLKCKIIAYRNSHDIDVEFEDGFMIEHSTYGEFKRGNFGYNKRTQQARIGEVRENNAGQLIKIIGYRKSVDIDVQFEDGTLLKHRTYSQFKEGSIKYTKDRVGETIETAQGLTAKIIEYIDYKHVTVELEDGTLLTRSYEKFNSKMMHPKYKKVEQVFTYKQKKWFMCTCKICNGLHLINIDELKDFECDTVVE